MSRRRRRGLLRLAVLVVVIGWFAVAAVRGLFSSGSSPTKSSPPAGTTVNTAPDHLTATFSRMRLPEPLHGATAAPTADGLFVIGGADRSDVSTDRISLLQPSRQKVTDAGTLIEPMHDAAAATVGGRALVFGGGGSTTFDAVQVLALRAAASEVGRLPAAASDLSAVSVGDHVYVAGGYDGRAPLDSILEARAGGGLTRVGSLPTPVRYTALASAGGRIYAFGGELADGSATDQIQEYDPATHRASVAGRLARPVDHAAALQLGGAIHLLGGRRNGAPSDEILRFEPSKGTTIHAGRLPSPLFDAAAGVLGGVGYLAGGIDARGTSVDSVVTVRD